MMQVLTGKSAELKLLQDKNETARFALPKWGGSRNRNAQRKSTPHTSGGNIPAFLNSTQVPHDVPVSAQMP